MARAPKFFSALRREHESPVVRNWPHMKILKRILFWSAGVVALWLAVCAVAAVVAVDPALHTPRRLLTPGLIAQATALAERYHAALDTVTITAKDGVVLQAWNIRPAHANGDAVILLHGKSDNRAAMLGPAEMLLRHGYAVLLPDARAHGASGGDLATYGIEENDDIRRWFDWLQRTQAPHCIDGLGNSMGAALLLESLKTERGYCAVVAESSYASFREASYDRIGQWFGTGPWIGRTLLRPMIGFGFVYVRWRYGVDLRQDDPTAAVADSHVPVLLIHGLLDKNLPAKNSEIILAESRRRDGEVALWEPPDAGHTGAAGAEPEEYERRVIGWFESHQTPAP